MPAKTAAPSRPIESLRLWFAAHPRSVGESYAEHFVTAARFGLAANTVLADPQLTLINQDTGRTVATNDDWSTGTDAAAIADASTAAGAFSLTSGSKDAAMLVMLPPGAYTVQLSGVSNGQGIAIVEVYDVDP